MSGRSRTFTRMHYIFSL